MRIFWDLGAFNGCNLRYYLKKADLVVAVEANPTLFKIIQREFRREIQEGSLIVENVLLVARKHNETQYFYVHKTNPRISTSQKPVEKHFYERLEIRAVSLLEFLAKHQAPDFVKIDLEGLDSQILKELFTLKIFPLFISVEAWASDTMEILFESEKYNAFQLVEGQMVPLLYKKLKIQNKIGFEYFSFDSASAGPCAEDLPGPWYETEAFRRQFVKNNHIKWKDIHAVASPSMN